MLNLDDIGIERRYTVYGAEIKPGTIVECKTEAEARSYGCPVKVRQVFETNWVEIVPRTNKAQRAR